MIWNVWSGQQPTSRADDVLFWPIAWEILTGEMLIRMLEQNINQKVTRNLVFENKYLFFYWYYSENKNWNIFIRYYYYYFFGYHFKFDYKIHETHVLRIMDLQPVWRNSFAFASSLEQTRPAICLSCHTHWGIFNWAKGTFLLYLVCGCFVRENEK